MWELRGRCNDAKKLRNSRDFTETVFASEVCSVTHEQQEQQQAQQQLQQHSSPENERDIVSPTANMALPGEVVIFDDIGDNWRDDEKSMEGDRPNDVNVFNNHTATNTFPGDAESIERVTKVIGNLPIAVYEGSPRRYGPRQVESNCTHPQLPSAQSLLASPSVYPPRPGFPQRVVCTPSDTEPQTPSENTNFNVSQPKFHLRHATSKLFQRSKPGSPRTTTSTFDYLYEFSETRKVLEEFFKCPPPEEENRLEVEFQDLEYELRRQAGDSGNSYVGQRLAKGRPEQADFCLRIDSPRTLNTVNLIGLQVRNTI